jgi:hypothetical protein
MREWSAVCRAQFEHRWPMGIFGRELKLKLLNRRRGREASSQTNLARARGALQEWVGAKGRKQAV